MPPRSEINGIFSAEDWLPTLLAAAGEPSVKEKLLNGYSAGDKTFKVHLDGYDQRELLSGKESDRRREFFYWTDDGDLAGLRFDQYKVAFLEQQADGLEVWMQPLVPLRAPKIFNLRSDPFERAEHEAGGYDAWFVEHAFVLLARPNHRRPFSDDIPGVSPAAAAGQFLGRSSDGNADATDLELRRESENERLSQLCDATAVLCFRWLPCRSSLLAAALLAQSDPLPSWNDTTAKRAIVEFVTETTKEGSRTFVPPAERIATFDQDGTLWVEHPMYSQVIYCLDRVPALVAEKPELRNVEPFKTVLTGDRRRSPSCRCRISKSCSPLTLTGMTVDEFSGRG